MGIKEVLDLEVLKGGVVLAWVNSYSGIMVKSPRATLIFDPKGIRLEEDIQADAFVITHEHLDHFEPELVSDLRSRTNAAILTTPFIARRLTGEKAEALRVGDSLVIKDIELHAERCDHPGSEPLSFIISTESGIVIYHPSDSEPFPEMAELRERFEPDMLLFWGTTFRKAAQMAKLVQPRIVLSYYTDAESARRFAGEMERWSPETEAKLLKRFEIFHYPDGRTVQGR